MFLISFGHLIVDAKCFVDSFGYISISHVYYQGNTVAYNFAKHNKLQMFSVDGRRSPHLSNVIHISIWLFFNGIVNILLKEEEVNCGF